MGDAFYPLKVSTVTTHARTHVIRCAALVKRVDFSFGRLLCAWVGPNCYPTWPPGYLPLPKVGSWHAWHA